MAPGDLWWFCKDKEFKGEIVKTNEEFKIKHYDSGKFLSLVKSEKCSNLSLVDESDENCIFHIL